MTTETKLVADLALSSYDVVNIVYEYENEFGNVILKMNIKKLKTIGKAAFAGHSQKKHIYILKEKLSAA